MCWIFKVKMRWIIQGDAKSGSAYSAVTTLKKLLKKYSAAAVPCDIASLMGAVRRIRGLYAGKKPME